MNTEEYLQRVTIGGASLHNQDITLLEYDPQWPLLFQKESEKIRAALPSQQVRIEHVGSTSIPGLCAKPIIDILMIVQDASDENSYVPPLTSIGYLLRIREPDWYEHRMLKGQDPTVNLHVFSQGCEEAERMLLFRDWLRTHPEDRDRYADTKRQLARRKWKYVQDYANAKSEVVQDILLRAQKLPD